MKDEFGDRMKAYEKATSTKLKGPFWVARIDGRSFSKLTKGLKRPFDPRFSICMRFAAKELTKQTKPLMAYTQSDEITLIYDNISLFGGKVQKLTSVLSGIATASFNHMLAKELPDLLEKYPHFDCRVYDVPNNTELANSILWRVHDCGKNSVSMAARAHFSHKELQGKCTRTMLKMLEDADKSYKYHPNVFKYGAHFIRETVEMEIPHDVYSHLKSIDKAPEENKFLRTIVKESHGALCFTDIMDIIYGIN